MSAEGRPLALLALLAGAVGIGFAPIFVRFSDAGLVATAFWRIALAWPLLLLWLHLRGAAPLRRPPSGKGTLALFVSGFCFAGDLAVWHWSIYYTSVANATLLTNTAPVFVTLAAWLLYRERLHITYLIGLVAAMLGALLLMSSSLNLDPRYLFGDVLGLLAAVFYAGYILGLSRARRYHGAVIVMAWSALPTAGVLLFVAVVSGENLLPTTIEGWGVLLALALISQLAGQGLITYAMAHLPVTFSALSLLLQPVVAALLAWLLFDEALGPLQWLGAAVILAGILFARFGPLLWRREVT